MNPLLLSALFFCCLQFLPPTASFTFTNEEINRAKRPKSSGNKDHDHHISCSMKLNGENPYHPKEVRKRDLSAGAENGAVLAWPNGEIPYTVQDNIELGEEFRSFNTEEENLIKWAIATVHNVSCVRFVPFEESRHKRPPIVFQPYLDHSAVCAQVTGSGGIGRFSTKLEINKIADADCKNDKGINVLHELLHVVGFYHEHQREDRDKYVKINHRILRQLDQKYNTNDFSQQFEIMPAYEDQVYRLGKPYDYGSIMHYDLPGLMQGIGEGKEKIGIWMTTKEMSYMDIIELNLLYNCTKHLQNISTPAMTSPATATTFESTSEGDTAETMTENLTTTSTAHETSEKPETTTEYGTTENAEPETTVEYDTIENHESDGIMNLRPDATTEEPVMDTNRPEE